MQTIVRREIDIYEFFESKDAKLYMCLISAFVSLVSNYSAVKYQLNHNRFDLVSNPSLLDFYTIGFTILLEAAIIVFALMRIKFLTWCSTIVALLISVYANIQLMFQVVGGTSFKTVWGLFGDPSFFFSFVINISMAILPIVVLKYMTVELVKQLNEEKKPKFKPINLD